MENVGKTIGGKIETKERRRIKSLKRQGKMKDTGEETNENGGTTETMKNRRKINEHFESAGGWFKTRSEARKRSKIRTVEAPFRSIWGPLSLIIHCVDGLKEERNDDDFGAV